MVIVDRLGLHQPGEPHAVHSRAPRPYTTPQGITHHYGGIMGILGAAGVVFFAFIGFDAVSTAAQEAKNPKRDMPIGILGSLVICTDPLRAVLPRPERRRDGRGLPHRRPRGVGGVRDHEVHAGLRLAVATSVTVAILAGFSSVILVMLLGQSRVFYSMSRDGLVPKVFSDVHPKFRTPYKSNLLFFVFTVALRGVHPRGHRRRDDQHRDAVRVHPGLRGRLDHARPAARHPARRSRVPALSRWSRSSASSSAAR